MSRSVRVALSALIFAALSLVALVIAIAELASAGHPPVAQVSPTPAPAAETLSISNGTSIAVALEVNGHAVETVAPRTNEDPIRAELPSLPWSIVARSPSGRVLAVLTVRQGDVVVTTPNANGHSSAQGSAVRVDLSCGRLDIWSGPPLLGPMFSPGPSGDCD